MRVESETALWLETTLPRSLAPEHSEVLVAILPYLPDAITLESVPHDGTVRLRLTVPVPDGRLTLEALDEALSLLFFLAPVLPPALALMQQGAAPEEALQHAQEAPPAQEAEADTPATSEALQALLQELVALQERYDYASLERKRDLCQSLLARRQPQTAPELWAALQGELGNTCQCLYAILGTLDDAQAAIEAYQAAFSVRTHEALPTQWAMTQNGLGNVHRSRYERSGEERWAFWPPRPTRPPSLSLPQAWRRRWHTRPGATWLACTDVSNAGKKPIRPMPAPCWQPTSSTSRPLAIANAGS
jgi:hypothetical protein